MGEMTSSANDQIGLILLVLFVLTPFIFIWIYKTTTRFRVERTNRKMGEVLYRRFGRDRDSHTHGEINRRAS